MGLLEQVPGKHCDGRNDTNFASGGEAMKLDLRLDHACISSAEFESVKRADAGSKPDQTRAEQVQTRDMVAVGSSARAASVDVCGQAMDLLTIGISDDRPLRRAGISAQHNSILNGKRKEVC